MELFKLQQKYVLCKPVRNMILKGNAGTGKREAMIHRIINIHNNFAYESDDRILVISKSEKEKNRILDRYNSIKEKEEYKYISLLPSSSIIDFFYLNELVCRYTAKKTKITKSRQVKIIKTILNNNKDIISRRINAENIYLLINEIKYMKINRIKSEEEFLTLNGTFIKYKKNSSERKLMYKLYELYNEELDKLKLYDEEDLIIEAIENIRNNKYSHVFIDGSQNFSKLELELIFSVVKDKKYSTLNLVIDLDKSENIYSSIISKGKVHFKNVFEGKKKVFKFETVEEKKALDIFEEPREEYTFIDFKHNRSHEFVIMDNENLIQENEEGYDDEQVVDLPVFSNIAAGEPILINPEVEDVFTLPKEWLRGRNKKFLLRVKGDSMINANINDGDLVVIEQNQAPNNGDIVAVNIAGSATLKRLKVEKDSVMLLPENEKYEPIIINEMDEFYILGKAIGVIKKN